MRCGSCGLTSSADSHAIDSSVAVATVDELHEFHSLAGARVRELRPVLAGHATFETYSVLTRRPEPRRLSGGDAALAISVNFPESCWLSSAGQARLVTRAADLGLVGGAIYDALVAQAALENDRVLLTLDRRAERTYQVVGVDYELLR